MRHKDTKFRKKSFRLVVPVLLCAFVLSTSAWAQEVKTSAADPLSAMEASIERAADRAAAAVVAVRIEREAEDEAKPLLPGLRAPGGEFRSMLTGGVFARRPEDGWCTGTIVEADGTILTTHFNVAARHTAKCPNATENTPCPGKVKSITVRLTDGRELKGALLGYNATFDLAAIKVEAEGLPVLPRARLDALKTGQALIAVGRAPDGRGLTANPGILSAPSRLSGRAVQTDAKLNYGNVGGPLVDAEGRLVGITCKVDVKFAANTGQNSGVGYAITHDRLGDVLADLKQGKNVAESRLPYLGVRSGEGSDTTEGFKINQVIAASPAEKAGLKTGDVIFELGGHAIHSFDELRAIIGRRAAGDRIHVKAKRGAETLEFDVELGWRLED